MILPTKHIRLSESLFGLGGFVTYMLSNPKSVDELWNEFSKINDTELFPSYHSFDNFVLCIDYLFMIGFLKMNNKGKLHL